MTRMGTALIISMAVLVTLIPVSSCDAGRTVGLSLGTGTHFPMGDLADKDKIGAKSGLKGSYALDIYLKERLSVGAFIEGDFFEPTNGMVRLGDDLISVSKGAVTQGGGALRYFFSTSSKLQPFAKAWLGVSWLHLEAPKGSLGADSENALGWGLGVGVMLIPVNHIGLSGELMYNNTKTGENPSDTTPRISLGVALHLLIG